ncbi:MAG: hypothetical protein RI985_2061 [Chloroflexota bacterium]|jgi:uncharacterized membrane protein YccF (DUF307 family)
MQRIEVSQSPNIIIRIIWFVVIGLWLSGIWTVAAWAISLTIIGLPIGMAMLNALPQITTLRARQNSTYVDANGRVVINYTSQYPLIIRIFWFVLVGWWLSAIWLTIAWACSATIIGLPISFWMIDRAPKVMLLTRN